jgi:hypothetical protein
MSVIVSDEKSQYQMPDPIDRTAYVEITLETLCQRLGWLRDFQVLNGFVPDYRTIAQGWQVSPAAISTSLEKMVERGWVRRVGRNIVLTGDDPCHKDRNQTGEGARRL